MHNSRNGSYGHWGTENHRNLNNQGVQFRSYQEMAEEDDDSGVVSPPLWKNSPSPPKSPSYPLLPQQNTRFLSPNSRAQAIARGQWELMEMVKNMPESSYELSLKDLVEHPRLENQNQDQDQGLKKERNHGVVQDLNQRRKVKRQESEKIRRSGSFENRGMFLNMFFPVSLKSKKKKKSAVNSASGKVSPKPEGSVEKDWWKKRFKGSTDSDGSRGRTASGSSASSGSRGSGRKKTGFLRSCWPCFYSSRSKPVE